MIIVYLLSGPVAAALLIVALIASGASTGAAVAGGLIAGFLAPAVIAGLHLLFKSKLRLKLDNKLSVETEQ